MSYTDQLNKDYADYIDVLKGAGYEEQEINKYMYVSTELFNITTYNSYYSDKFGREIIEVISVIVNNQNFEYIRNDEKHEHYLRVVNYDQFGKLLEWGTSIRGAWFDNGKKTQLGNIEINNIQLFVLELLKWVLE